MKRWQVEKVADAIKFLVPLDGSAEWTEKGLATTKWPKDFSERERKMIRAVAGAAVRALEIR